MVKARIFEQSKEYRVVYDCPVCDRTYSDIRSNEKDFKVVCLCGKKLTVTKPG